MNGSICTFQVYRADRRGFGGMKRDKHGVMIGAIRASIAPCGIASAKRLSCEKPSATHEIKESLFTIARPDDVLVSGLSVYDVVAVEDIAENTPYSVIYVARREAK